MGYGVVYKCPKCRGRTYYGMLKRPGVKLHPCPNCESRLVRIAQPAIKAA